MRLSGQILRFSSTLFLDFLQTCEKLYCLSIDPLECSGGMHITASREKSPKLMIQS